MEVFPIPEYQELVDYAFWTDDRRAIAVRAYTEEEAWQFLTEEEQKLVQRVEVVGKPSLTSHERQLIAKLAEHPSWPILRRVCKEQMDRRFRVLAVAFVQRNSQPDYDRLQWVRGFFAGMKFLLDNPMIEEAKLIKALDAQDTVEGSD